jgi:hypothetical protein
VVVGIRQARIGTVNAGMLVITAIIVARFFDVDMGFVVRGIAFIIIGAGFMVTNIVLGRKMKNTPGQLPATNGAAS